MTGFAPPLAIGPIRQVLLQPTSFCNIACRYCYLDVAARARHDHMTLDTVQRAFELVASSGRLADDIDIRWHAGEPLTRQPSFYRDAHQLARSAFSDRCRFEFSIQTNGLLINPEWCRAFAELPISVGLSIDGQQPFHDRQRVDRRGVGTWDRLQAKIALLREHQIPFDVICVLGDDSLQQPDAVFKYFHASGCRSVGFNTDDLDPRTSDRRTLEQRRLAYAAFMERIAELEESCGFEMTVRELHELRQAMLSTGGPARSATAHPFAIVSIGAAGAVSTCSPELLTLSSEGSPPRILGNVWSDTWHSLVKTFFESRWSLEILEGTQRCAAECSYFELCGGGSPANKHFEHGTFRATETFHCRSRIQSLAEMVLTRLEHTIPARPVLQEVPS